MNTYVKLQMSVEIAPPALSSLYSVSNYYLFNDDRVKICIKSVSTRAPGSRATCYLTDFNETLPV